MNNLKFYFNIIKFATLALTVMVAGSTLCLTSCQKKQEQPPVVKKEKPSKPFAFDDYNSTQLPAAQKYGITPIQSRDTDFSKIKQLEKIENCDLYDVNWLSHSVPYLTHNAKRLLEKIGQDFQDSLRVLDAKPYKVVVTSVLRTLDDVQRLQRVNSNSSANSCHCYATTFDLAHNCFNPMPNPEKKGKDLTYRQMKRVLGHVLFNLRVQGRCWVLQEERQPCFHITVNS